MSKSPKQTFFQGRYPNGQQVHEKMLNITNHHGNANENHGEISPHRVIFWPLSKRQEIRSVGEDVEQREPFYSVGGNVIGTANMENNMEVPQ